MKIESLCQPLLTLAAIVLPLSIKPPAAGLVSIWIVACVLISMRGCGLRPMHSPGKAIATSVFAARLPELKIGN